MAGASVVDTQLSDMVAGSESCGEHAVKRAREYAAAAHFIGLLAGVVGSPEEISEARATVKEALAEIGFSADDAANRRSVMEMNKEWYKLKYETPTAGMNPSERAAHDAKIAGLNDAISNNPVVQKWSPSGIANRLWGSLKQIYNDAIKFVREDMWKLSACKLSVDAGFFILENGLAVALAAAGMAAAAAVLKIVAIASRGARLVRISVIATRGLAGGAAARNPGKMFAEKTFKRDIDTGAVSNDAKKFLDESGQGTKTADRSKAKGEEGGAPKIGKWQAKDVNRRRVYQQDKLIDPNYRDPTTGLTNKQLMQRGDAPYGADGKKINLHHLTQDEPGAMAELAGGAHSENNRLLHIFTNDHDKHWRGPDGVRRRYNSAPESMDRGPFNAWKKGYWIERAKDFQ
jgi:A nuclease of the HNH/ENDO VII superfamily with conserved LHH